MVNKRQVWNLLTRAVRTQHLAAVVIGLHLLLSIFYSISVPLWEAYDEWGHYVYVHFIATHRRLPQGKELQHFENTEVKQPPLYYILCAAATSWIDASDWQMPVQNRYSSLPTAMGGYNRALHGYEEDFPWRGSALAAHVARFVSVLLGTVTVWLTYLIGRYIFPCRSEIGLGAAAISAFWPKFVFMNSVINNDNLMATSAALLMFFMVRNVIGPSRWQNYAGLVASQGLAIASKIVGLAFLPVTLFGLAYALGQDMRGKHRSRAFLALCAFVGVVVSVGLTFLWAHPHYVRNFRYFLNPPETFARVAVADWLGVLGLMWGTLWASFGWQNISIADWGYRAAEATWTLALLGLIWFFLRGREPKAKWALAGLILAIAAVAGLTMYRGLFNAYYFTGRYLVSTISAIAVLLAVGLGSLGPRRCSQVIIGVVSVAMFLFAVYVPFAYIMPVYARPQKLPPTAVENLTNPLHANFDGKIELVGYEVEPATFYPGQTIKVSLYWRCLEEMTENYTLAIKIIGPDGQEYSSLNVHPGRGNYPTSMWRRGDIFKDEYWMPIVGDATPLTMARLKVAFFLDQADLPHLRAYDQTGQKLGFAVFAGRFKIAAIHKPKYEPQQVVNYRLGEAVSLIGYDLPARLEAGAPLTLTLYWQAHGATERPYTVFVHVTDARGELRAQADRQPLGGSYPTDLWGADEVISDTHTIALPAELPAGRYGVVVGLYSVETGQRLPVSDSEGRPMSFDQIELGWFELAGGA